MPELDLQLELVGLLCSRICHDLVNPVGAIANGLEVLAEEDDPAAREEAIAHITVSTERASQRLQFLRYALGGGGGQMALQDAGAVARATFSTGRHKIDWQVPPIQVGRQAGRLLLNFVMVAEESLPIGGVIETRAEHAGEYLRIEVIARGERPRLPAEWDIDRVMADGLNHMNPRGAQVCHALLLARALGAEVEADIAGPDRITYSIRVPATD